ncbi:MAG TPA: phosphoribosylaminoimidazolesuccinocarboxamide synthase [Candidatus Acidoferrum sp.]|nr:phosphoribosylaminoimidazolesuccinocarboxamide synthase [Candidatus Acidoferrum sp.]
MSTVEVSTGKTKTVTPSNNLTQVILTFRDDITAGDGEKHALLAGKGKVNAGITKKLYQVLEENGVRTHLVERIDSNKLLVTKLQMIPLEVVCRIRAAGHFVGIGKYFKNGDRLPFPSIEFFLKDDALHDPMLTDQHVELLKLANKNEIRIMREMASKAATILEQFFEERSALLIDFKLEFGRDAAGNLMIGDELSPDSWRLWDKKTGEILDKDRFRKDLPKIFELGYAEPYRRITGESTLPS